MSTITPNMYITLPDVNGDRNAWGTKLNTALETVIDPHDHTSGKGAKIVPNAIDINGDLTFAGNNATNLKSIRLSTQASTLATPSDLQCVYSYGGNLYYNNNSGTAVKITNGSGVNAAGITLNTYEYVNLSGNLTILSADTFYFIAVNTSSARSITLPAANSVAAGRHYMIKDKSGSAATNNISIILNGADTCEGLSATKLLQTNFGCWDLVSDGVSAWYIA